MKCGTPIDYIKLRKYKRLAREVIHDGGNLTEMARRADVSGPFISRYLKKHAPCLHARLKEAKSKRTIPPEVILHRLRVIKASRTQTAAARKLCLTGNAITYTLQTYAPDGLDDALALYEDAHGTPLLEAAA